MQILQFVSLKNPLISAATFFILKYIMLPILKISKQWLSLRFTPCTPTGKGRKCIILNNYKYEVVPWCSLAYNHFWYVTSLISLCMILSTSDNFCTKRGHILELNKTYCPNIHSAYFSWILLSSISAVYHYYSHEKCM